MMAVLFILLLFCLLTATFGFRRITLVLFVITLIVAVVVFCIHVTDSIGLNL